MGGLISVIIPALNEEAAIGATLDSVRTQDPPFEIIVVDGGSVDGTREIAARKARVLESKPGRAHQMNTGGAAARGDILLFLHADTRLPPRALGVVRSAVNRQGFEAGTFRLQFDLGVPLLRFYGFCTRLPVALLTFGDRGLFVRRDTFQQVGGFPSQPIFEDLELARTLHARGRFVFLRDCVTTSARRFRENGVLRQQFRNAGLWLRYLMGVDPEELTPLYPYPLPR